MSSPAIHLDTFRVDTSEGIALPQERYPATTETVRLYAGRAFIAGGTAWAMGSPLMPAFTDFRLFSLGIVGTQTICFFGGAAVAIAGFVLCRGRPCCRG